jgi:methionyl-tRNA formyltransferase
MISPHQQLKILFIGCVEFSEKALKCLFAIENQGIEVVGIVSKSISLMNADHIDLLPYGAGSQSIKRLIPSLDYYKHPEQLREFIDSSNADVIYCFGWSHLLSQDVLNSVKHGVIGFHPCKLPENRGRHPIIWTLALGLTETASTFFKMALGADSGPILSQKNIQVELNDNASTLYQKIIDSAMVQINEFSLQLRDDTALFVAQNHAQATSWRKRSYKDGLIDWRMSSTTIHNLVRALYKPYIGAEFNFKTKAYKVWHSELGTEKHSSSIIPGTVLDIKPQRLLIKCAGCSAIWLTCFNEFTQFQLGDCI